MHKTSHQVSSFTGSIEAAEPNPILTPNAQDTAQIVRERAGEGRIHGLCYAPPQRYVRHQVVTIPSPEDSPSEDNEPKKRSLPIWMTQEPLEIKKGKAESSGRKNGKTKEKEKSAKAENPKKEEPFIKTELGAVGSQEESEEEGVSKKKGKGKTRGTAKKTRTAAKGTSQKEKPKTTKEKNATTKGKNAITKGKNATTKGKGKKGSKVKTEVSQSEDDEPASSPFQPVHTDSPPSPPSLIPKMEFKLPDTETSGPQISSLLRRALDDDSEDEFDFTIGKKK